MTAEPRSSALAASLEAESAFVLRLARALARGADLADDAAQDALVAALERRPDASESLRGWLAATVRHFVAKHRRAHARRVERERAVATHRFAESPDRLLERAAAHRALVDAVMALPEPYRATILARYLEGCPPREIARRTGAPVRTVQTRIQRGLAKLRESLPDRPGGGAWMLLLFPWRWSLRRGLVVEAIAMSSKVKLAASLVAVALLLAAAWQFASRSREDSHGGTIAPALAASRSTPPEESGGAGGGDRVAVAAAEATKPESAPRDDEREIRGHVRDSSGAPVARAQIEVAVDVLKYTNVRVASDSMRAAMSRVVAETRSAADGSFRVSVAERRNYDLTAAAPRFATSRVADRHAGEEVEVTLHRAASIEGRVLTPDGRPVASARVKAVSRRSKVDVVQAGPVDGDDEGRFTLGGLEPGEWEMQINSPRTVYEFSTTVGVNEGEATRRDFTVRIGGYVYGSVKDAETGRPVADAEVSDGWWFGRVTPVKQDGLYLLEGVDEFAQIYVRAPGYGSEHAVIDHVADAGTKLDFTLRRGHAARGRIVDPAGASVSGAYVLAAHDSGDRHETITGLDGVFSIRDLTSRIHHTLLIRKQGFAAVQYVFPPREETDALVDFGDIALAPAGSVSGTVRDLEGRPIAECLMRLDGVNADTDRFAEGREFSGEVVSPSIHVRTDARGRFEFADVAEGSYSVNCWVPVSAEVEAHQAVSVKRAERLERVDFQLRGGLALSGVVRSPDGEPIVSVYIGVRFDTEMTPENWRDRCYMHTSPRGEFSFRGIEPGRCILHVVEDGWGGKRKINYAPETMWPVEAGATGVNIVLPRSDPIEGIVVAAHDEPVAGAAVFNGAPWCMHGGARTDDEGRFSFPAETGKSVDLLVEGPAPERRKARLPRVAAGTKNLKIQLQAPPESAPASDKK